MIGRKQLLAIGVGLIIMLLSQTFFPESGRSKETKHKEHAWLGVSIQEVPSKLRRHYDLKRDHGVLIIFVVDDSPADLADLESGDLILAIDGIVITSPSQFSQTVRKYQSGDKVSLNVIHDGKEKTLQVELAKPKAEDFEGSIFHFGDKGFAFNIDKRPFLGVYLQDLNEDLARYFKVKPDAGVLVTEVEEDSPAEEAGIKPGDILAKIADETVRSAEDVLESLADYEAGDSVEIVLQRAGSEKKVKVELEQSQDKRKIDRYLMVPDLNEWNLRLPPLEVPCLNRLHLKLERQRSYSNPINRYYYRQKQGIERRVEIIQHQLNNVWHELKEGILKIVAFKSSTDTNTLVCSG